MSIIHTERRGGFTLSIVREGRTCDIHMVLRQPEGPQTFAAVVVHDADEASARQRFVEILDALPSEPPRRA